MAPAVPLLLLLSAAFIAETFADDDCQVYMTSSGVLKPSIDCGFLQFCCGTCDNRYCCSNPMKRLSEDDQDSCFFDNKSVIIGMSIAGIVVFIIMFIVCCVCPCCCLYKMCRTPRPAMATTTTTVVSTQYPQQPVVQGGQYPPYQPMPAQAGYGGTPAYGGQPAPTGPYQGQPYSSVPPPPYQEAGGPGYPFPYSKAAYDGGQASYPLQPPVQPGFAPPPTDYSATQPAYNPAYVEQPKTGY
ncbi:protein shisa-5 isoform X2 [Puntigrus tetrazona]|uniref:protein shisa-5 isoform X2 n=1 Tax=Puntigrus tetrazona TaxID=1606681 RepID=UPI001C891FE0|nr:protein shisa-5 isoform X2 [Puntigrus tetrazona]